MMRLLDINQYADYSYIVTIVLWAAVLMDGGLSNYIFTKGLQNDVDETKYIFSSRIFLFLIIFLFLTIFFTLRKPEIAIAGILYSIIIFFNINLSLMKMLARGKQFYKIDLTIILSEPILRLTLFFTLYFIIPENNWNLITILIIYLIGSVLSFLINYYFLSRRIILSFQFQKVKLFFNYLFKMFKNSKYFIIYYLFLMVNNRLEIIFLEKNTVKDNLALFASSKSILDVVQLFLFSLLTSHFFQIYNNQKKSYSYMIIAGFLVISITTLISKFIFKILFPIEYIEGYKIINIIIYSNIPYIFIYFFIAKLNFENKTKIISIIIFIPLILKIFVYNYYSFKSLRIYSIYYVIFEYITFLLFIFYFILNKVKFTFPSYIHSIYLSKKADNQGKHK